MDVRRQTHSAGASRCRPGAITGSHSYVDHHGRTAGRMRSGECERSGDAADISERRGTATVSRVSATTVSAPAPPTIAPVETAERGERFFLLLAIFIGIFSGLAVV